jgi:hypothetical protein
MKLALAGLLILSITAQAKICSKWSNTTVVGQLNPKIIDEASGIAVSKTVQNRLYHINDSGDGPHFYSTDTKGGQTQKIRVSGLKGQDVEDLAYGKCGKANCIFIGDIGDNKERRSSIQIAVVQEQAQFGSSVDAIKVITARYPDRAHNAESLALHPISGDLFIITKEMDRNDIAKTAKIFKISAAAINNPITPTIMTEVGEINIPELIGGIKGLSEYGKIATSFDISPDGKKFIILTYQLAIEVNFDLTKQVVPNVKTWKLGLDFGILQTVKLPQQEAITYHSNAQGVIYNSEFVGNLKRVDLFSSTCQQ